MMKKGANLEYKCRNCGEIDRTIHVPDGNVALVHIMLGQEELLAKMWGGICPHLLNIHNCSTKHTMKVGVSIERLGISDLIGCEFD